MSSTPPHTPIIPGSVLAGKYRVEKIIGQGGMGLVVEARHIALDERVALKFLLPEYASHPEASTRFLREARAAVKIKSEHVARVSDVGTLDSGAPYMVMEFLEGADLSKTLEKLGVLQVPDAIDYIIQGCEAIAEAHQHGIVHRDLKPANLFLSKRPDGTPIVKVLDFGISKVMGGGVDNLTKTTAAMGSALYMSPEQMQQTRAVDHRTDIYALGIALYELLAGKQPYYADTLPQLCAEILTGTPTPIRTLRPEIPDELATVMEKAYARDRAQRFQSIADLVIALAPFAPARAQQTIDRVARMAGLPIPTAGMLPPRATQPSTPFGSAPPGMSIPLTGGTQVIQQYESPSQPPQAPQGYPGQQQQPQQQPQQRGGTVALPAMDPSRQSPVPQPPQPPPPPPPGHDGHQIVLGSYQAPVSTRAAANFKQGQGQTTDGSMSSTGSTTPVRPAGGGSKVGLLIAAVLGVLVLGGLGLAFVLKGKTPVEPVQGGPQPELTQQAKPPETAKTADVAPPETAKTADVAPPIASTAAAVEPPGGKLKPGQLGKPLKGGTTATPAPTPPTATPAPTAAPKATPAYNPLEPPKDGHN